MTPLAWLVVASVAIPLAGALVIWGFAYLLRRVSP